MSWCIRQHLQIVWSVFVVRRNKDRHKFVQELLTRGVVREESIPIHKVKLTLTWVWEAQPQNVNCLGCI